MADRTVVLRLRVDSAQYQSALRQAGQDTQTLASRTDRAGVSMKNLFKVASVSTAALGITRLVEGAVSLEAAYSKTMAQVAVATGAPKSALNDLDALALKLGRDTVFSAQDAAEAMLDLAKGGLSVAQIKAGALRDTLTLASAGGLELGDAAKAVVNSLGAFQLSATETSAAVAALAGAANASSADVSDITQALSQTGTSAHSAGLSIQQTTAFLAEFANSGIKGSDAGTSLRTMLTRLVPQTKQASDAMKALGLTYVDSNGKLVSASQIADRTQKAFKNLSDEDRIRATNLIFGNDAQRAVNVITEQGSKGLEKYVKQTSDLTQAQKLAKAANSGTSGSLEQLKGTIETAEIQIGKGLAPTVRNLADNINELVQDGDFETWASNSGQAVGDFLHEMEPLAKSATELAISTLPTLASAAGDVVDVLELGAKVIIPLVDGFNKLPDSAQKALLLAAGIRVLSGSLPTLTANSLAAEAGLLRTRAGLAGLALQANAAKIGAGTLGIGLLTYADQVSEAGSATNELLKFTGAAATGFAVGGPWGAAIGGGIEAVSLFGKKNDSAARDVSALTDSLNTQSGAFTRNTRAMVINSLNKPGANGKSAFQLGTGLGFKPGEVTDAALGDAKAMKEIVTSISIVLDNEGAFTPAGREALALAGILKITTGDLKEAKSAWDDHNAAVHGSIQLNKLSSKQIAEVTKATKGIPKSVATKFTQPGYDDAVSNVADIARRYHLTPKQVTTAMRTLDYSSAKIRTVLALLGQVHSKSIDLYVHQHGSIGGSAHGGRVPAGYARGGRVPGTPPANPWKDNVLAMGLGGKPMMVRSGEWIINGQASNKNDAWLKAVNNGLDLNQAFRSREVAGRPAAASHGAPSGPFMARLVDPTVQVHKNGLVTLMDDRVEIGISQANDYRSGSR